MVKIIARTNIIKTQNDNLKKHNLKINNIISDCEKLISNEKLEIASTIAKVELLFDLVNEFPELQGTIGVYYAIEAGFEKNIADVCKEHYAPLGPSDEVPSSPISIVVALADKIDTLTCFWSINEKPTGSKDPFALRRSALGLIRIIIENDIRISLSNILAFFAINFGFSIDSSTITNGNFFESFKLLKVTKSTLPTLFSRPL